MRKIVTHLRTSVSLVLLLLFSQFSFAQTNVNIPGDFNSELGCSGDWMPDCDNTALTYNNGTGMWEGTFNLPAGNWQYKVAINHSWSENYGANGVPGGANIPLNLPVPMAVTFKYDPLTHFVTDSYNTSPLVVTLTGSFQSEAGCGGDWDPSCTITDLNYDGASGLWTGNYYLPPGTWEFKVAINHSWNENYGAGGVLNGPNYSFTTYNYGLVAFHYDPNTHIVSTGVINNFITVVGNFQHELGCSGDWMPDCYNTTLQYNYSAGLWKGTFIIPAGSYEFKIAADLSWNENYGDGGVLNGSNMSFHLPAVSQVEFSFDPFTHLTTYTIKSITVVIAGDFQNELGCVQDQIPVGGDWEPGCDITRLTYDAQQRIFTGTFSLGAGHWEYKVTINNSWTENYGLYGQRDGPNIPLDLKYPCKITFQYDPITHLVTLDYITTYVCINKFYDANVNGYQDYNEQNIAGVSFHISGSGVDQTLTTGGAPGDCFGNLSAGTYTIRETVPSGYYTTSGDSQVVYINNPLVANFGNVCLGAGGAKGVGFWTNKNGETAINQSGQLENILSMLRYFGLRNADGSDFDPYSYAQLKTWMQGANAKNMAYMLSAQLAAMYINMQLGYVSSYNSYVYTPGCGFWGNGNFMDLSTLIWYTNYWLWYKTTVDGKDPDRSYLECLKKAFDNANNNLNFVQSQPCDAMVGQKPVQDISLPLPTTEAVAWPNPSSNYFIIRPSATGGNETVQISVMDINGKLVYTANGNAAKDYKFGEQLKAGLYFAQITQGNKRSTIKLIKQ